MDKSTEDFLEAAAIGKEVACRGCGVAMRLYYGKIQHPFFKRQMFCDGCTTRALEKSYGPFVEDDERLAREIEEVVDSDGFWG